MQQLSKCINHVSSQKRLVDDEITPAWREPIRDGHPAFLLFDLIRVDFDSSPSLSLPVDGLDLRHLLFLPILGWLSSCSPLPFYPSHRTPQRCRPQDQARPTAAHH